MNVHFNHYTRVCVLSLGFLVFTPSEAGAVLVGAPGERVVAAPVFGNYGSTNAAVSRYRHFRGDYRYRDFKREGSWAYGKRYRHELRAGDLTGRGVRR